MISRTRSKDRPGQDNTNKLPVSDVGGRFVTTYNQELALEILEQIAAGKTLNEILKGQPGMPDPRTFRRWVVQYPELAKAFIVATTLSASSLEEEALDSARLIAATPKDGTHVRAMEVKLNQLRWSAERRDPAKFGNRSQINVRVPVQIVTPLDLGYESHVSAQDIYTIDAKQTRTVEETAAIPTSGEPLVEETPLVIRNGKRVLPSRQKSSPFQRAVKDISHEGSNVRTDGSRSGDRQARGRPRDPGVHQPGTEEGPAYVEENGSTGETTEGSGES